jgi:hypothetical protein
MGLEIRTFDGGRGTYVRYFGRVEDDEFIRVHSAHLFDHPEEFAAFRYSISDSSEVTSVGVRTASIRRLATALKNASVGHAGLVHVSVHPTILAYGLGRMNDMLMEFQTHWEFETVRDLASAHQHIRTRCAQLLDLENITFELDPDVFVAGDVEPTRRI